MLASPLLAATVEHIHRALDVLLGEEHPDAAMAQDLTGAQSGARRQEGEAVVEGVGQLLPAGFAAARIGGLPGFQQTGKAILPWAVNQQGLGLAQVEIHIHAGGAGHRHP